jgi:hypothetical protein
MAPQSRAVGKTVVHVSGRRRRRDPAPKSPNDLLGPHVLLAMSKTLLKVGVALVLIALVWKLVSGNGEPTDIEVEA